MATVISGCIDGDLESSSIEVEVDPNIDSDGDGVRDVDDPFPQNRHYSLDNDTDGIPDEVDECIEFKRSSSLYPENDYPQGTVPPSLAETPDGCYRFKYKVIKAEDHAYGALFGDLEGYEQIFDKYGRDYERNDDDTARLWSETASIKSTGICYYYKYVNNAIYLRHGAYENIDRDKWNQLCQKYGGPYRVVVEELNIAPFDETILEYDLIEYDKDARGRPKMMHLNYHLIAVTWYNSDGHGFRIIGPPIQGVNGYIAFVAEDYSYEEARAWSLENGPFPEEFFNITEKYLYFEEF